MHKFLSDEEVTMDTTISMQPSGGFVEGFRSLITTDVVSKASVAFGESESAVTKGLSAAVPALFGVLASKASDRSFMSRIVDMVKDPVAETSAAGNVSQILNTGESTGTSTSLGNRFMSALFGGNTESIGRALSSYAGVRPSTGASMLGLAAPLALGYLGRTVRSESLDATSLSTMLLVQKNRILGLIPRSILNIVGITPLLANTATTIRTSEPAVRTSSGWMWFLAGLLGVLAIWGLYSSYGRRDADYMSRTLPGGAQLQYVRTGVEGKLLSFIEDPTMTVEKDAWFDFDRLLFETDSARIQPESRAQLGNIASILRAYPNVHIKVGGYTDNSGDSQANLKLSQDRATSVVQELLTMGISPDRLSAEGYGEDHPAADNSSVAGRAQNRRVAIRVVQK
jgi:OOP family OmpA-OmpF porin